MNRYNFYYFFLILIFLSSCKKFEGDDNRSSYTVKGRLTGGVWNLKKIEFGSGWQNLETEDDIYACVLDFGLTTGANDFEMKWGYEIARDTVASFTLSSDKESLNFFNTDFRIYSMTWTDMILESSSSGNRYHFEKWINTTVNEFPIEYDTGFYMPFW